MALSKNLAKAMASLQKTFDSEMVGVASEAANREIVSYTTGSLMLDMALGGGSRAGFPEGRMIELYGPESSGKTTTALIAMAARQQLEAERAEADPKYQEKMCVFVDAEHALDMKLAEEYGVDLQKLIYINPETAEDAMDALDLFIRTGEIGMAIVDSVAALVPAAMEESSYQQQFMALNARFMSGVCQRMTGPLYKHGTTLVFINQIREQVGKWSPTGV